MIDLLWSPKLRSYHFIDKTLNNDTYHQTQLHLRTKDVAECSVHVPQADLFELYAKHDEVMEARNGLD